MHDFQYPAPLNLLLSLGKPEYDDWESLTEIGFDETHIPGLIAMIEDPELDWESDEPLYWAPVHAWRILGVLKAEAAIQPLLNRMHFIDDMDDEWAQEELPVVFGRIGAAAVEPLSKYLADPSNGEWSRVTAAVSLHKIGEMHPEQRDQVVAELSEALECYADNPEIVNGFIVSELSDLKAVETVDLVKQAFDANRVDYSVMGDFEEYQIAVGLLEERLTPIPPGGFWGPSFVMPLIEGFKAGYGLQHESQTASPSGKSAKKAKSKRKQARQSRKKNRKKRKN